jgi:serine/threonine protein kinase
MHEPIDASTVKWDAWASIETLKEVVSALIFLHEHNILHGDLKAANVLLASSDEDRRRWIAKVADFGLARVLKDKSHIKTQTFGTVTHMPPELLAKGAHKVVSAWLIYSSACLLDCASTPCRRSNSGAQIDSCSLASMFHHKGL